MNLQLPNKIQFTKILAQHSFINKILSFVFYSILRFIRICVRKNGNGGVVIVSLHKIGDTVFSFPAVKSILEYYSDKKVTIVCHQSGKEIYEYFFKNCSTAVIQPKMFYLENRWAGLKARKIIKELDPEIIIDFTGCMMSAALIFNSGAKEINGSNREIFKGLYTHFTPLRTKPHLTELYLDSISSFVPYPEKYKEKLFESSFNPNEKILIHPFAGWRAKEWGIKKFINLAVELNKKYKVEFVVEQGSLNQELINELDNLNIPVRQTTSISDLLKLIEECSLMISNDTGCIYLAAAMGKATYTIYGPTNPEYSAPVGTAHSFVQKKIKCTPETDQYCFTFGGQKGCPSFLCMQRLSEDDVIRHLTKFMTKIGLVI